MNGGNRQSHMLVAGLTLIVAAFIVFDYQGGAPAVSAATTTSSSSCYVVVALDPAAGLVTVKDSATGATKKLRADPKTLAALKVGMGIYPQPSGGTSGSPKSEAGTTSCGSNVGRNAQTKACYDSQGHVVLCNAAGQGTR